LFSDSACALVSGAVRCWGYGLNGLLGQGNTDHWGDSVAEASSLPVLDLRETNGAPMNVDLLSVGGAHACARSGAGTLKCWGANTFGQLGLGDTATRGDNPSELGTNLPVVSLGFAPSVVSAGGNHTCALSSAGVAKCWGNNSSGQLGLGDTLARGDAAGEMGGALPALSLGSSVVPVGIHAGASVTCALFDNKQVKCWGSGASGLSGGAGGANVGDQPGELGDALPFIDFGSGAEVQMLTVGSLHACAFAGRPKDQVLGGRPRRRAGLWQHGNDRR
jgi:E3 ubiquitin-protein ligase HERC3